MLQMALALSEMLDAPHFFHVLDAEYLKGAVSFMREICQLRIIFVNEAVELEPGL